MPKRFSFVTKETNIKLWLVKSIFICLSGTCGGFISSLLKTHKYELITLHVRHKLKKQNNAMQLHHQICGGFYELI